MENKQTQKIVEITKETYELIGSDFAETRIRPWPEMEMLVNKYIKDGQKVLDLGCGNGRILEVLRDKKVSYLGVDGAHSLLKEAEKKLKGWQISRMISAEVKFLDILDLNFLQEDNFDVILMFASFNHLPTVETRARLLKQINKFLKPGGILIMTNWNLWQLSKKRKTIWKYKLFRQITGEQFSGDKFSQDDLNDLKESLGFRDVLTFWQSRDGKKKGGLYYRVFRKGELKKLFKQAGFEVLENYYSLNGGRSHWWKARNIVTVGRKR